MLVYLYSLLLRLHKGPRKGAISLGQNLDIPQLGIGSRTWSEDMSGQIRTFQNARVAEPSGADMRS